MKPLKIDNQEWLNQIINSLKDGREWKIHKMPELVKHAFKCYVCEKKEPEYEIVTNHGNSEVYWLGTSCIKLVNKAMGYDIRIKINKGLKNDQ